MIAIMIGAMFLILMGMIDLRIPGTYIVTFVIFIGIIGHVRDPDMDSLILSTSLQHLCGGGLMLGCMVYGN